MRCTNARRFLSQAMDEQLPPAVTRQLDEHLDGCRNCRDFREDLVLGRRLLGATEPSLPENFDWRLQLRLNQALQHAAGETAYPWLEEKPPRRAWAGSFTTAAAFGLAAVLALAMFIGPVDRTASVGSGRVAGFAGSLPVTARVSDRLPLTRSAGSPLSRPRGIRHSVSRSLGLGEGASDGNFALDRGWSGNHLEDLMTIQELRLRNQRLNNQLYQYQREIALLRERLDRPDSNGLDLGQ